MPLARNQEMWLLACATLTLLPHAAHAPVWLTTAAVAMLAWRVACWFRRHTLPPTWGLALLVAAGSVGVYLTYHQFFGKDPGIALLILFLPLKLMELRSVRDALAVIFLCYFLLLTHFLNAQGIEVALLSGTALVFITGALASLAHAGRPAIEHLRQSAIMLAQATPFMLVLFLLFPRVEGPLWGLPVDAYSGLSGLSDTMSPGSISNLSLSSEIAFRVKFEGDIPPKQLLYWRGPVLHFFDGRTWRAVPQPSMPALPYQVSDMGTRYMVTLEPHNKTWLFALEMPGSLPGDAAIAADYQLLSRMPVRTRLRYELRSHPGFVPGADEPTRSIRTQLLLPPGNPRTRELALAWREELGSHEAILNRMLDHIRKEKYSYTLAAPLLGEHSVDEFLFETRRGFCEHFASAFVFTMRAAGVPARIVTGYQGGERNPVDGYVVVRQSDAHAWAEVWLEGRGWVRVDPTAAIAPSRIETGLASAVASSEPLPFLVRADISWLRTLRFRWEAITNTWNQWVLGYNPQRQREVLSRLGMREPDWQAMTSVMTALCGLLLLGLMAWSLHKRVRLDPTVRTWNRLSRKLAIIGLERKPWEGPTDYASRVARTRPALATPLAAIAALYIDLRYGRLNGAEPRQKLRQMISRLDIRMTK